jgi:NitT/TauT family transport system permease protein
VTLSRLFKIQQPAQRAITWGDIAVLLGLAVLIYAGVRLAFNAPATVEGPSISLSPRSLPWYAGLSITRMVAAYTLSLLFALLYGYLAACNRHAEQVLMPLLDVLQSVPILAFLPVVLLRAYPNNPAARKAMRAHAKCRKAM